MFIHTTDIDATKKSMELSNDWAYKSKKSFGNSANKLFGIIQGGFHLDLRQESLKTLNEIGFDGYALGGYRLGI